MFLIKFMLHVLAGVVLSVLLIVLTGGLLNTKPVMMQPEMMFFPVVNALGSGDIATILPTVIAYVKVMLESTWVAWAAVFIACQVVLLNWVRMSKPKADSLQDQVYYLEENLTRLSKLENSLSTTITQTRSSVEEAYRHSGDAFVVMTADGFIQHTNAAAEEDLSNWRNETAPFTQRYVKDVIPHFMSSPLPQVLGNMSANQGWRGDVTFPYAHLMMQIFAVATVDGAGYVLIWRDVSQQNVSTEHKDAAVALNAHILAEMKDAVAVLDAQGNFVFVSAAWRKLFRVVDENWKGQPYYKQEPLIPENWSTIKRQILMGEKKVGEQKISLFGEEKTFRWHISPWRNEETGAVMGCLVQLEDMTEQQQAQKRLEQLEEQENKLAYNDLLTGLPNRQLFNDRLSMALATAYRQLNKVALLFLDLDGFKAVNDTLGHDIGDMLLKEVSQRLLTCVRQTDTVARLGGDEFTVILAVRDVRDAQHVADKMIEVINKPYNLGGKENIRVGTSIGVAMYPEHASAGPDLIRASDSAMYVSKKSGKNKYTIFTPEMLAQAQEAAEAEHSAEQPEDTPHSAHEDAVE